MATDYKGIDYGAGNTNRDNTTGIRYGVISQNDVLQAWADSSEPYYTPACPHCGNEIDQSIIDAAQESGNRDDDETRITRTCPHCSKVLAERDFVDCEPSSWTYDDDGYSCECGESGDIFVIKSPYFTYAQLCSPCAPGACHLGNPLNTPDPDNRAYCFGHDWFDDGRAPYPVYSVETGEMVQPDSDQQ